MKSIMRHIKPSSKMWSVLRNRVTSRGALTHFALHVKQEAMEKVWEEHKDTWCKMVEEASTAAQVGLLLNIFHHMMKGKRATTVRLRKTKKVPPKNEEPEWCNKGHRWMGATVRREYGANGYNVGTITKWMPPGEDNPEEEEALWHVVFDDGDEEDLDEAEVEEAIRLFEEKGNKSVAVKRKKQEREDTNLVWKKKGHEWIGSTVRVDFGDDGFSNCKVIKWAENKGKKGALWCVVDEDQEEHNLNKEQMEDGIERFAEHEEFGSEDEESGAEEGVAIDWHHTGHPWLNRFVMRDYGETGTNQGTITKWVPADPENPDEDPALWHVVFQDGDEEDLEQEEVEEALELYALKGSRKRGQVQPDQIEDGEPCRPRRKPKISSETSDEMSDQDSETESDDGMPSVTLSGRVRHTPERFEAGPATSHA